MLVKLSSHTLPVYPHLLALPQPVFVPTECPLWAVVPSPCHRFWTPSPFYDDADIVIGKAETEQRTAPQAAGFGQRQPNGISGIPVERIAGSWWRGHERSQPSLDIIDEVLQSPAVDRSIL